MFLSTNLATSVLSKGLGSRFSVAAPALLAGKAAGANLLVRHKHIAAVDGNEAAAYVAYGFSDVGLGYPITPASGGFELMEKWASSDKIKNVFGEIPNVFMMESEAGVSGAMHGALTGGALCSTFTSCQGLMLMIPNLFKMGCSGLPGVIHVASRSISRNGVTIFTDHSSVYSTRPTGWALLASANVQEANDLAMVAHLSSIKGRVPFIHFYDGFRTSHEVAKIERPDYDEIAKYIPHDALKRFHSRAFNPEHPKARGSVINNDVYMQFAESVHPWFAKLPYVVEESFREVEELTGRHYSLFDYHGHPEAEYVVMLLGSAANTAIEAVNYLNKQGNKYGVLKVHLFRPFSAEHFLKALPPTVKKLTVLDRVREFGATGEPLYMDVAATFQQRGDTRQVVNGIYGLGGKDFTPTMAETVFENMKLSDPKRRFTVGIVDDVMETNLPLKPEVDMTPSTTKQCLFWASGADGTVGANKEAISIISNNTDLYAQGYFLFEAKKSGGWTYSHLRFGPEPILSEYEIQAADYVAVHNPSFLKKYPVAEKIKNGGTFVVNTTAKNAEDLESIFPDGLKKLIAERDVKLYSIDATGLSDKIGLRGRINLIMQSVFFKLSGVVDHDFVMKKLEEFIVKQYSKKGEKVVQANISALHQALPQLLEIKYPAEQWKKGSSEDPLDQFKKYADADAILRGIFFPTMAMRGETVPVSAFLPVADGMFPLGTSKYEKRDVAVTLPEWNSKNCSQCNECVLMCPHAAIRPFILSNEEMKGAPEGMKTLKSSRSRGNKYSLVVSPMDCISCGLCEHVCPDNALKMVPKEKLDTKKMSDIWDYCVDNVDCTKITSLKTASDIEFHEPLLEFSAACAGCGETAYMKMLTQMFGDRMYIANAHGCSIVWAAPFPSIAYTTNAKGYGPTWGSSLFEDAAEYGFGMINGVHKRRENLATFVASGLNTEAAPGDFQEILKEWIDARDNANESTKYSDKVKEWFAEDSSRATKNKFLQRIYDSLDLFRKPSQWIVGGDGWAYDIGYNGLDHVLSQDANVNIIVLDNESYANTGFQLSKATPHGSVVKFAASGNKGHKKDLGMIAMQYGHVYIAQIAIGADINQAMKALKEAEEYNGPSLILAYCPCIGHGIAEGLCSSKEEQRMAVDSGYWPLWRYNPTLKAKGKNPFILDSKKPKIDVEKLLSREVRYTSIALKDPELAARLHKELQQDVEEHWAHLQQLAAATAPDAGDTKKKATV